jgi:hypothetical protein|eukprot:COSAG06_NODE_4855_length_3902_cov_29.228241_2_plen_93_part_00
MNIEAGPHSVVFEFYENGGGAYASLDWEQAAGGAAITVAGDNSYELMLNGESIGTQNPRSKTKNALQHTLSLALHSREASPTIARDRPRNLP